MVREEIKKGEEGVGEKEKRAEASCLLSNRIKCRF
jgi:hypothetical protein